LQAVTKESDRIFFSSGGRIPKLLHLSIDWHSMKLFSKKQRANT
jgi:hypothetical protein